MKSPAFLSAWLLGVGLVSLIPGPGFAQAPPPFANQAEVNRLSHELAGRVRHLGEDIASDLGQNPNVRHMLEDTQELAQAVDEFHDTLHNQPDINQAAQSFTAIDQTWQHLRGQLTRPGTSTDGVNRAIVRVDELVVSIRQNLNVNPQPQAFYGYGQAPSGLVETQRLANALVSRAQGLHAAIQVSMRQDATAAAFSADVAELVQVADRFHDTIDANQPIEVAAQAFAPVDQVADRVERFATSGQVPPQVQQAWQAYASVEVLIHQNLGLNSPQPVVQYSIAPPAGGGPSPMLALSGQLVDQINAYVATFSTTARNEPEGLAALSDAQRLLASAANFQQVAVQNPAPNQLAFAFRDVDASWQRLMRRASRIAKGRNGPYVQQVRAIGGTCEQIHRVLGMTGYPPVFANDGGQGPPPPPPGSGPFR